MLYQRVTGDFYTINSEGKFTLPGKSQSLPAAGFLCKIKIDQCGGKEHVSYDSV